MLGGPGECHRDAKVERKEKAPSPLILVVKAGETDSYPRADVLCV